MSDPTREHADDRARLNPAKLWSGGVATAVVAGLIVLVGTLIVGGVMNISVLTPGEADYFASTAPGAYAAVAAAAALLATGMLHLLLASAPRPMGFFGWIMGLAVAVATVSPFTQAAAVSSQIASAIINGVTGVAIASLLGGVAGSAVPDSHARTRPHREDGSVPGTGYGTPDAVTETLKRKTQPSGDEPQTS